MHCFPCHDTPGFQGLSWHRMYCFVSSIALFLFPALSSCWGSPPPLWASWGLICPVTKIAAAIFVTGYSGPLLPPLFGLFLFGWLTPKGGILFPRSVGQPWWPWAFLVGGSVWGPKCLVTVVVSNNFGGWLFRPLADLFSGPLFYFSRRVDRFTCRGRSIYKSKIWQGPVYVSPALGIPKLLQQ